MVITSETTTEPVTSTTTAIMLESGTNPLSTTTAPALEASIEPLTTTTVANTSPTNIDSHSTDDYVESTTKTEPTPSSTSHDHAASTTNMEPSVISGAMPTTARASHTQDASTTSSAMTASTLTEEIGTHYQPMATLKSLGQVSGVN